VGALQTGALRTPLATGKTCGSVVPKGGKTWRAVTDIATEPGGIIPDADRPESLKPSQSTLNA
jgi:hypothetical protein